jgi:hypothetical protein
MEAAALASACSPQASAFAVKDELRSKEKALPLNEELPLAIASA